MSKLSVFVDRILRAWFLRNKKIRVFINYRKGDSQIESANISNALKLILGDGQVFFDDNSLPAGQDYRVEIKNSLYKADAVFSIIGEKWLTITNSSGELRIRQSKDVLRKELELALERGIPVVPILLPGVKHIPNPEDMPPSLNDLSFLRMQAHRVKDQANLRPELQGLVDRLRPYIEEAWLSKLRERIQDSLLVALWSTSILVPLALLLMWSTSVGVVVVAFLALILISLLGVYGYYRRIYKLIYETLFYNVPYGWWKSYVELLNCLYLAWGSGSMDVVSRVRIEVAILYPDIPPPAPNVNREQAIDDRKDWLDRKDKLNRLFKKSVDEALQSIRANANYPPLLHVATCFQLNNASARIERYLNLLQLLFPESGSAQSSKGHMLPSDEFYCRVRIAQGFIAPQHLIAGMQDHYDEDWRPVLNWYGRAVIEKPDLLPDKLRRIQVFQFLCWLMWGPSIPHCKCTQWRERDQQYIFQLGYGDEGNSWPLSTEGTDKSPAMRFLNESFQRDPQARAFQCRATVRPAVSELIKDRICPAQIDTVDESGFTLRLLNIDRFESDDKEKVGRRVFQAYVWVMFVICDSKGKPLFPDEPWKGLVPFFVHGNIAEPETYHFVRKQVATIAIDSLRNLIADASDITFRYACASDDGNCGSELEFEPAAPTMLDMIGQIVMQSDREHILLPKAIQEDESFSSIYAACHLPELVAKFYESLPDYIETEKDDADELFNAIQN